MEKPRGWSSAIRRIVASGLVAIGVLCALFAGVFRYVDQHFHTPETFLENTGQLADNADVRQRLFEGFRGEIISLAEGDVFDETAEEADVVEEEDTTEPVTEEQILRDQTIEAILLDVFDSDLYQQTFSSALERTQVELIASAELEPAALLRNKGEVFFDMRRLYPMIYERLAADPATAEITQNEVPPQFGIVKVADRDTTMNFLWSFLRNGPNWRGLATLGAIATLIGAVVVAERRPSTVIQFGGGIAGLAVVVIVIVFLIQFIVPLLAGGGSNANSVTATYVANTRPLVGTMIRFAILGAVLAAAGAIARMIWPDDWVYSSVSDDRGVRSIRRRKGAPEAEPTQPAQPQSAHQPAAAAGQVSVPGAYGGYPQPYGGYPPQWGQPYPGQYPPGYPAPYPAGPYAQAPQPLPQHYAGPGPGKPTVPLMPIQADDALVPPPAPPLDAAPGDLPADAAQAVPKVVATTEPIDAPSTPVDPKSAPAPAPAAAPSAPTPSAPKPSASQPSTPKPSTPKPSASQPSAPKPRPSKPVANDTVIQIPGIEPTEVEGITKPTGDADGWASENDW